jgi:hypothetical protein
MAGRDDLIAFARRDWHAVGRSRLAFWVEQYRRDGGESARRAATQLYEHARRLHCVGVDAPHRGDDLAAHLRLRDRLDRAAHAFARR